MVCWGFPGAGLGEVGGGRWVIWGIRQMRVYREIYIKIGTACWRVCDECCR